MIYYNIKDDSGKLLLVRWVSLFSVLRLIHYYRIIAETGRTLRHEGNKTYRVPEFRIIAITESAYGAQNSQR